LAGLLHHKQIRPGEPVAIVMEKGLMQIIAALGILKAGAAYLPVDNNVPDDRLNYLITNSNVRYVIAEKDIHRDFSFLPGVEIMAVDEAFLSNADDVPIKTTIATDSLAYIIYTSGSTGRPKGVMITHDAAMNTIFDMNQRFQVGKDDRAIAISEMSFDLSVYDVFGMFASGGGLVIPPADTQRDPKIWVELVKDHNVTLWNSVPAFVEMLVQHLESNMEELPLKHIWMSGDWIPVTLPGRLKKIFKDTKITSLGGATEASIWSITYPIEKIDSEWESVPYGKPLGNQRFYVLDEFFEQCPYWTSGQLYIGGDGLALGYINDREKTQKAFITHPRTGEKLYRTGDWGYYRPDGNIIFLGREDLQVKISGYRIELGEIEVVLNQHAFVKSAIVNTYETQSGKKQLIGYVIPEEQNKPEIEEIKEFLSEKLPKYMIPNDFVFMDAFPLNPNGKIDRKALSSPILSVEGGEAEGNFDDKTQYVVDKLTSIFANVLGLEQIDIHQNFFSMGGDSILGVQIINDANSAGIHITPQDLFEKQTIAALVSIIDTNQFSLSNKMYDQYPDEFNLAPYQEWYNHRYPHNQSNYAAIFRTREFIDPEILETAYQHLINHFDVLQIQFQQDGTGWHQYYSDSDTLAELNFVDVTSIENDNFKETTKQIREQLEEMLELDESPILKLCVFQNAETQESYLLLVAHQLIMDMRSLELFVKELNTAYGSLMNENEVMITRSGHFYDWVQISKTNAETESIKQNIETYAAEVTQQSKALRLKPDNSEVDYDTFESQIVMEVQNELPVALSASRLSAQEFFLHSFTEAFAIFQDTKTVYLDWVVHPSKDQLNQTNLSSTMGPLGWAYPMRFDVNTGDPIEERVRLAKACLREHSQNGEAIGLFYCLQEESTDDRKGRLPDIKFQYQEFRDTTGFGEMISCQFSNQSGFYSLEVDVQLIKEKLFATWHYDPECFTSAQIKELSEKYQQQIENMIANAGKCDHEVFHFSDFPLANLTQEELNAFVKELTI
jgi:amino acid adenylation domain-containing protein/non-ribosomal peptide synthase protein (TIGR01720 family)